MKPAHYLATAVIAITLVFTLFSFSSGIAPYVTVAQAMQRPEENLQVRGKIIKESIDYVFKDGKGQLQFTIVDKDPSHKLQVVYSQPKPENFDTATDVEAIGKFSGGVFKADKMLVKCPSKYSDEKKKDQAAK